MARKVFIRTFAVGGYYNGEHPYTLLDAQTLVREERTKDSVVLDADMGTEIEEMIPKETKRIFIFQKNAVKPILLHAQHIPYYCPPGYRYVLVRTKPATELFRKLLHFVKDIVVG